MNAATHALRIALLCSVAGMATGCSRDPDAAPGPQGHPETAPPVQHDSPPAGTPSTGTAVLGEVDMAIARYVAGATSGNPFDLEAASRDFDRRLHESRIRWIGRTIEVICKVERFHGTEELLVSMEGNGTTERGPRAFLAVGAPLDGAQAALSTVLGGAAAVAAWIQIGSEIALDAAKELHPGDSIKLKATILDVSKVDASCAITRASGLNLAPATNVVVFGWLGDSGRCIARTPEASVLLDPGLSIEQRAALLPRMTAPIHALRRAINLSSLPSSAAPIADPTRSPGAAVLAGVLRNNVEDVRNGLAGYRGRYGAALAKALKGVGSENVFVQKEREAGARRTGQSSDEYRTPLDLLREVTECPIGFSALHYASLLTSGECAKELASTFFWPGRHSERVDGDRQPMLGDPVDMLRVCGLANQVMSSDWSTFRLTPLHLAAMFGRLEVIRAILPAGSPDSVPTWARAMGWKDATAIPPWINEPDLFEFTATDYAVMFMQRDAESALREAGGTSNLVEGDAQRAGTK